MKKVFASVLASVIGTLGQSAETPTITVSKSDKLTIAVGSMGGEAGPQIAKTVQNDLVMSGYFRVSPPGNSAFTVQGSAVSGRLQGTVVDSSHKTVLSKGFSGAPRQQAHAFADEILETLTGSHGIAQTKIGFVATRTGHKEIYLADADGANVTQLTRDENISVAPCLSPDGRSLAYTGYKSGYADVYEINLGSGARSRIIKYPGTNSGAAYAPDGNRLAVTLSKDGNPELYVTSANGSGARRLTRTRGVESSPTWSPDGSEIIYSSDENGTPQLYRISAAGGNGQLLSTGRSYNTEPSWSPDGKKIAFNAREGGSFEVAILDLATRSTRTVGEGQDPVWGADSRHLLYASGGSLIMLDAQTGQRTVLITDVGKISEPTWSR
jgi:TolB protein